MYGTKKRREGRHNVTLRLTLIRLKTYIFKAWGDIYFALTFEVLIPKTIVFIRTLIINFHLLLPLYSSVCTQFSTA